MQQQKQRQGAWMGWMLAARMSDNNNNGESNNKQAAAVLDEDDSNNDDNDDDFEALFAKYCDSDGLISKESVLQIPSIANLLVRVVH